MTESEPRWSVRDFIAAFFTMVTVFFVIWGIFEVLFDTFSKALMPWEPVFIFFLFAIPVVTFFIVLNKRDKSGRSWKLIFPESLSYFFGTHNHPLVGPLRVIGVGFLVRVVFAIPWVTWAKGDWLYWRYDGVTRWFWQSGSVGVIDVFQGLDLSPSLWTLYFIPCIALLLLASNLNKQRRGEG